MTTSPVTPDELVKLALLEMLHDRNGLAGVGGGLDYARRSAATAVADNERLKHLEGCPDAVVLGPVTCEQDATSTGSGFEVMSAPITCPHGEPLTAQASIYGIGNLLPRMIEIGRHIAEVRECEAEGPADV